MADLEAVLADVSYLMAMEKSRTAPGARASKKMVLPDIRHLPPPPPPPSLPVSPASPSSPPPLTVPLAPSLLHFPLARVSIPTAPHLFTLFAIHFSLIYFFIALIPPPQLPCDFCEHCKFASTVISIFIILFETNSLNPLII